MSALHTRSYEYIVMDSVHSVKLRSKLQSSVRAMIVVLLLTFHPIVLMIIGNYTQSKIMATKLPIRSKKAKARKNTNPLLDARLQKLSFILLFAFVGTLFIWYSFAATATTSFAGKLSPREPTRTHMVKTTASGTFTATTALTKLSSAKLELLTSTGTVLSSAESAAPQLSVPVGIGDYTLRITGKSNGNYKINVIYPVADPAPTPDTTPPSAPASLVASTVGATQINLSWQSATDNVGVAAYEVLRNGTTITTTMTTTYSDVNVSPATTYTYTVRAKDAAGNVGPLSAAAQTTTPAAPDTAPPSVTINSPTLNQTVSGTITVQGAVGDNIAVSQVQFKVDNGAFVPATIAGNTWSYSWNTTAHTNGSHNITALATDTSGNASSFGTAVIISNSYGDGSGAPETQGTWVSPEGMEISFTEPCTTNDPATGQPWTIAGIYNRIKAESAATGDFSKIAPTLKVKVQTTYASSVTTGSSSAGGIYTSFDAFMFLKCVENANFSHSPDAVMAHEYGHVWTLYHLYMSNNGDKNPYLATRWVNADGSQRLLGWPMLESSYSTAFTEIIADDYKLLFGTQLANTQRPNHLCSYIIDPRQQPGLRDWLLNEYSK